MSDNPVATIGNSIPQPSDPRLERKTYTVIEFDAADFYGYKIGEQLLPFNPSGHGDGFVMTVPLYDALVGVKPDFVTQANWDVSVPQNVAIFPSVFVSGAWNSIMP
jgi:hypothetical protein